MNCYLCDEELTNFVDESSNNHYEHIIPQSLGGHLKVKDILCKTCGGDKNLGGKIDAPFAQIFNIITQRIEIKKDRNTNPAPLYAKYTNLENNKTYTVHYKDKKISPAKPSFELEDDNINVFVNKKTEKDYLKKINKDYPGLKKTVVNDFNSTIGFTEFEFNLKNNIFKNGLVKIAIEFALYNNVSIDHLIHNINREQKEFSDKIEVIPYFPSDNIEKLIENHKSELDDNFLSHTIMLFTQKHSEEKKQLYCYIELFSTFQYYVVLNDKYKGSDIHPPITYSQKFVKKENDDAYEFDLIENLTKIIHKLVVSCSKKEIESDSSFLLNLFRHLNFPQINLEYYKSRIVINNEPNSNVYESKLIYLEDNDILKQYTYNKFKQLEEYINIINIA